LSATARFPAGDKGWEVSVGRRHPGKEIVARAAQQAMRREMDAAGDARVGVGFIT
jgi:hypothetical protein